MTGISDVRLLIEGVLGRPIGSLTKLGKGTDHVAYDIDGTLVARVTVADPDAAAADLDRERQLMSFAATVSPIPVPEVVASDTGSGLIILTRLPGTSLLDEPTSDPEALVDQLAGLLSSLCAVDLDRLPAVVGADEYPLESYLADAVESLNEVAGVLDHEQRGVLQAFLSAAPPPEPSQLYFCHNDLGAEHLLAGDDRVTLTGVIDWSDAAVTDVARDLGRTRFR